MDEKAFQKINDFYRKRRSRLLLAGKAQRPTAAGYWAASDPSQIYEIFKKIKLQNYGHFVDLGSGDGIVVAVASLFTDSAGIEIDGPLHSDAMEIRDFLELDYSLIDSDYMKIDLSIYDVLFINPDNYFHKLEKKISEEFKGTLILVDNMFKPLLLKPEHTLSAKGLSVQVYKV